MIKLRNILYAVASVAFYFGAVYFFIADNIAAGVMGTFAGTLMLVALLMGIKKNG